MPLGGYRGAERTITGSILSVGVKYAMNDQIFDVLQT